MAQIFSIISIISFVLAGIAFIVAVILFFKLNIRKVYGDLSGRTEKKYVEMQKDKLKTAESTAYTTVVDDNISRVREIEEKEMTEKLESESATTLLGDESVTTVLSSEEGTTVLSIEELDAKGFVVEKDIVVIHTNEKI